MWVQVGARDGGRSDIDRVGAPDFKAPRAGTASRFTFRPGQAGDGEERSQRAAALNEPRSSCDWASPTVDAVCALFSCVVTQRSSSPDTSVVVGALPGVTITILSL